MTLFMILGGLLALGLVQGWRLAVPPRGDLAGSIRSWDTARARANRHLNRARPTGFTDRIARRIADELSKRGKDGQLRQDLAVTETTMESYLSRTVSLALLGLLGPIALFGLLDVAGLGLPVQIALVLGLVAAAGAVAATAHELRENAKARRKEMRRALSIYLDLVAMSLQAGRAHAEAVPAGSQIGTGWAFEWLQEATVEAPRWDGITAWAALGRLGRRIGMSELTELEGTLTLAQDDGAKVTQSLIAKAKTLRDARVSDAEADAEKNTESMRFTLIVMAFALVVYEFYPAISRLFS